MMICKRLIATVSESKKYIAGNVMVQWAALLANIVMIAAVCALLEGLYLQTATGVMLAQTAAVAVAAAVVRLVCHTASARLGYLSGSTVKQKLRALIYRKLLRLGPSYQEQVKTSEVVQITVEGVEQLETYFAQYLPQFFYAMLAPVTLFVVLAPIDAAAAAVLLICVPLIPVSIAAVQTWAKKLLGRYWGQYTALGDSFLENLQGLTTLKIYQADGRKQEEMAQEAERFRRITMKVLTMQLNSIAVMDLIAYGGAAAGMIIAVLHFRSGQIGLFGCLMILLLAADFFLPMRLLGSFFHIAMNGMAASDKIFALLDLEEPPRRSGKVPEDTTICCSGVQFSYDGQRRVLEDITACFARGKITAVVGESGCGKSTLSSLLMGQRCACGGVVSVGGVPLQSIDPADLMTHFTYVSHQSYLFRGTVRSQLLLGDPHASEAQMWQVLEQVNLADFVRSAGGLDLQLQDRGSNLSGGQCQRLALARALLHDSPVYIFDEATSNIDVESENDIMRTIFSLRGKKTVVIISHRLANVAQADCLYVMQEGRIAERGSHAALLARQGYYAALWQAQQALETYGKEEKAGCAEADLA